MSLFNVIKLVASEINANIETKKQQQRERDIRIAEHRAKKAASQPRRAKFTTTVAKHEIIRDDYDIVIEKELQGIATIRLANHQLGTTVERTVRFDTRYQDVRFAYNGGEFNQAIEELKKESDPSKDGLDEFELIAAFVIGLDDEECDCPQCQSVDDDDAEQDDDISAAQAAHEDELEAQALEVKTAREAYANARAKERQMRARQFR